MKSVRRPITIKKNNIKLPRKGYKKGEERESLERRDKNSDRTMATRDNHNEAGLPDASRFT